MDDDMSTRNILDSLGNTIGQLTLPDEATEGQWTAALTPYTVVTPVVTAAALIKTIKKSGVDTVTTSVSQPSTISGMLDKPEAGAYLIDFSGAISTGGASAAGKFGIYVDDVLVAETLRPVSCNLQLLGGLVTVSLNNIGLGTKTGTEVVVNGNQVIDVKFFSTNGGVIGFGERVMTMMKVR